MKLSLRKKEILNLLAKGLTDKEIAQKLNISKRTVNTHVSNILNGLNARNRVHAVVLYMMAHPRWKIK